MMYRALLLVLITSQTALVLLILRAYYVSMGIAFQPRVMNSPKPESHLTTFASHPADGFASSTTTTEALPVDVANLSEQARFPQIRWVEVRLNGSFPYRKCTSIAIGCALTSRGSGALDTAEHVRNNTAFFRIFLPSFCDTCSRYYRYHFYLAYDVSDPFYGTLPNRTTFTRIFWHVIRKGCPRPERFFLHFVTCQHSGKPAWAQNDAMMAAYLDDMDYYFRVNDDTIIESSFWTERYIQMLGEYRPANVGVVGPRHFGGNYWILTYDFVHRTHIDIFGFYYPRTFTDWFADGWITGVYSPNRTTKVTNALLTHEASTYHRYSEDESKRALKTAKIEEAKEILDRYLHRSRREVMMGKYKVISMSFLTESMDTLFGVLRNANLVRQFWPGWNLRVYTNADYHSEFRQKILSSLRRRGVQIIYVDAEILKQLPACMWRYLVADDETVDYFFIRDAQSRLLERDYVVTGEFLQSGASFHCIRDHPDQADAALTDGLWGADRKKLRRLLNGTMRDFILNWTKKETFTDKDGGITTGSRPLNVRFLRHLWHWVSAHALCHDSVSCERWPRSRPFPCRRQNNDYIGCLYAAFGGKINQKLVYGKKYCVSTNSTRTC